jgi:hypothetical protein
MQINIVCGLKATEFVCFVTSYITVFLEGVVGLVRKLEDRPLSCMG